MLLCVHMRISTLTNNLYPNLATQRIANFHLLTPPLCCFICFPSSLRSALDVSRSMGDQAYEAQACYSLGNTYTLMKDFPKAIDFHSRHLRSAIQLQDRSVS